MYQDIFHQLGLSSNEAQIYEYLLKHGKSQAGEIIKNTPLKRGLVYNILADLSQKGLISEEKKAKIANFSPNHPEKLREYLNLQENKLIKAKNSLDAHISSITSQFNLISGKPGVRYFEGDAGIKKVLEDSLMSKEAIYTYADIESIVKHVNKINQAYVKKRDALGIKKRLSLLIRLLLETISKIIIVKALISNSLIIKNLILIL